MRKSQQNLAGHLLSSEGKNIPFLSFFPFFADFSIYVAYIQPYRLQLTLNSFSLFILDTLHVVLM